MFSELQDAWSESFPNSPPVRHILRRMHADRWVRVYGLPGAKRVPTGPDEERELVQRHELVAGRLLPRGCECALIAAYANGYQGDEEPPSVTVLSLELADDWSQIWANDARFADDLEGMTFAVSQFAYQPEILASLVLDVAKGRTAPLLVFAVDTGRVYSPYDGGMDLFLEDSRARDALREELSEWVSHRADGL